ncbi:hypothetical protein DPMN_026645, partial [Dreissena polymorpha]
MMAFRDDNTTLIRMKRDFDAFISSHNDSRGVKQFKLDDIGNDSLNDRSAETTEAVSVQALLDKERQYKTKEAEYIHGKSELIRLKTKLSNLERENKQARIDLEQQLEKALTEKTHESNRVSVISSQLKRLEEKESAGRELLAECRRDLDRQRAKFDAQILALQKEKIQLSDELQQEKDACWEKITELKSEVMRRESELNICQCTLEETKAQLKLQSKRSADITSQMHECGELKLKITQYEQKVKELELQLSRLEEDSVVGKAMKSQLATFQHMERQNRKLLDENTYLKGIQENNLLLKEQHESMKAQVERLEAKLSNFHATMAENEELKQNLDKWENLDTSGHKLKSPTDLSKRVAELQNAEAIMLCHQGELQTNLNMKDVAVRSLQDQLSHQQTLLNNEKAKQNHQADLIKRLQRKLLLVTKERDGFKRIIDSYESEVTVSMSPSSTSAMNRVQLLEETVQGYKKQTETLERECAELGTRLEQAEKQCKQLELSLSEKQMKVAVSSSGLSSESDKQTILNLRERIVHLEKLLEQSEQDKNNLECRIEQRHLQGDYDPTKLKVLHLKMNPVDVELGRKREELTKLQEENARLRQRIKLLEENEGKIEDLTVAVEAKLKEPGSSKDIEEMRSQLSLAEMKNKRLMEAFKVKSQEVREVCYQLTGYKIDIPISNQYRLTSMYAESPSDFLLFQ